MRTCCCCCFCYVQVCKAPTETAASTTPGAQTLTSLAMTCKWQVCVRECVRVYVWVFCMRFIMLTQTQTLYRDFIACLPYCRAGVQAAAGILWHTGIMNFQSLSLGRSTHSLYISKNNNNSKNKTPPTTASYSLPIPPTRFNYLHVCSVYVTFCLHNSREPVRNRVHKV